MEEAAAIAKATAESITVGDPKDETIQVGPLVSELQFGKVQALIQKGIDEGAKLETGGVGRPDGLDQGYFVKPTIFSNVTNDMSIAREEIFGPVLSIVRVKTYEEGVALINSGAFGNGTAIFTNDGGAARKFVVDIEVGMVGVNVPIPVPMAYFSFGGWKQSLFGDSRAHGAEGFRFFTKQKVVTSRWLDPSHGGLNLGFPQN